MVTEYFVFWCCCDDGAAAAAGTSLAAGDQSAKGGAWLADREVDAVKAGVVDGAAKCAGSE